MVAMKKMTCLTLSYLLRKEFSFAFPAEFQAERAFCAICLYAPGRAAEGDVLQLCLPGGETPAEGSDRLLLHLCAEPVEGAWSLVLGDRDPAWAVSRVWECFNTYREFVLQAEELVGAGDNLVYLVRQGERYLHCRMAVIDRDYTIVVKEDTGTEDSLLFPDMTFEEQKLSLADLQLLSIYDPDLRESYQSNGLTLWKVRSTKEYHVYYYNFFLRDKFSGRMLACVPEENDCQALRQLLSDFSEILARGFRAYIDTHHLNPRSGALYDQYELLVRGGNFDRDAVAALLGEIGWKTADDYHMLVFRTPGQTFSPVDADYFCELIEKRCEHCLVIYLDGQFFCLHNFSVDTKRVELRQRIAHIVQDTMLNAGVSRRFSDVFLCPVYVRQALDALRLGHQKNHYQWFHSFSDLIPEYLRERGTGEYPARDVCHPALRTLKTYDEQHEDSDLIATLRQYLICGGNASQTAEALFIHRTTCFYRLRRIQKLTGLNLEDWHTRLGLLRSFDFVWDY